MLEITIPFLPFHRFVKVNYVVVGTKMIRLLFSFLELRENLTRLGANLKQSLIESARKTWESINEFARAHSTQGVDQQDAAVEEATEAIGNREIINELIVRTA